MMTNEVLFEENNNSISEMAWAFTVYSLVPYLGILFVPFGIICGGFAVYFSFKNPQIGGRKLSINSIIASFVIFFVQILFWYLLYIIPELARKL
jgi:hypothetical protein